MLTGEIITRGVSQSKVRLVLACSDIISCGVVSINSLSATKEAASTRSHATHHWERWPKFQPPAGFQGRAHQQLLPTEGQNRARKEYSNSEAGTNTLVAKCYWYCYGSDSSKSTERRGDGPAHITTSWLEFGFLTNNYPIIPAISVAAIKSEKLNNEC